MDGSGTVVVGVDGSPGSMATLMYAYEDAIRRAARLRVIAVVDLTDYWAGWRGTAAAYTGRWPAPPEDLVADTRVVVERLVGEVTAAHAHVDPPVSIEIEAMAGHPAQALLDAARSADLIVVGHRGRGRLGTLLGSVGLQCVLHAHCPVTIVRPAVNCVNVPDSTRRTGPRDERRD